MELYETIRRRSMVRSFSNEPVAPGVVDRILDAALRSPTAGNTGGTAWVVLEGPEETAPYWDTTTDDTWRVRNPGRFEGLRRAPVVLLSYASPAAYADRYKEPDKSDPGLGAGDWPVPYWYGDAAFGVMTVLLGAVDAGLGACVLGSFRGEEALVRGWTCPKAGGSLLPWSSGSPTATTIARAHWIGSRRRNASGSTVAAGEAKGCPTPGPQRPQLFASTCSGPSCQRAMAHNRSDRRLR